MLKPIVYALALPMALAGCASVPNVPQQACPAPVVPAWVLEPAPSLLPMLDKIISPYVPQ